MKTSKLLLGDEALALAACDAGVKAFYGYPGTPSTEIFEAGEKYIKLLNDGRVAEWAANEKVAYEFALGTSYTGYRSVVTMKHVGLNVAFDAFINSAITGIQGGLIVAVADDPGMHSSQNEQDTRYLADFANLPLLEPSTPQEVYDFTIKAFALSEKLKLPVVVRLVTRLAHSRGEVSVLKTSLKPESIGIPPISEKFSWVLVPSIARVRYKELRRKMPSLYEEAKKFNSLQSFPSAKVGVITSGMGSAYFYQYKKNNNISDEKYNHLNVKAYPLDMDLLHTLVKISDTIYVFEENYPYLEDMLIPYCNSKCVVRGRRDQTVPVDGELNISLIRQALENRQLDGKVDENLFTKISSLIEIRPPKLCEGCGHRDTYQAITTALKNIGIDDPRIFGDIGCYSLGVQPPYFGIHTLVDMGASLSMAFGAALAGMTPSIGIIGDSTFFHSGMPTLLSAAKLKLNINFIIMDNAIVGMTGQQAPVASDVAPLIAKAAGFRDEQIHLFTPLPQKTEENVKQLEQIFQCDEPSLIIFKRKCIIAMQRKLYPLEKKEALHE